jgi:D-alanine transaminase
MDIIDLIGSVGFMDHLVLFQDRILSKHEISLSPDDRGYVFGDGIYEVFRIYNGKLYETEAHMQRLLRSAQGVMIDLPYEPALLVQKLHELLQRSNIQEGILYMQITRGIAPRAHLIPEGLQPVLYAYCSPLARPHEAMQRGIKAVTAEDIRWHRCDLKTLNLLPNTLARSAAKQRGADEVIMHRDGRVTECSSSNFMIVQDGVLRTHPADQWILHGITRQVVLRLARELAIPVAEEPFTIGDIAHADEAFITGTTSEITPIVEVDGRRIGSGTPGEITMRLQEAFERTIM